MHGSRSIALLLVFLVAGFGCAATPGPGREPVSPSLSGPDQTGIPSSRGIGPRVVPSSEGEGYLLMSNIRRSLDTGRGVGLQQALRLIELIPDSSYGRFLAGSVYLRNKDIENARTQFIRASELDPANGHALSALGDIALEAGDLTEADQYYSKAHEAAPSNVTANRLALLRIRGGYLESAKEILEKALTDDPADIMTRNNLAIAMDMMGTTSEGINILAMDGMADPRILRTVALLQLKEGRPERAAMVLKTVYDAGISEGEWLLMGTVDLQQGKLSPAEDKFRSAIVAQPSGYEGYLNLGLTLRRQGRFTEAEKTYREGLARASHPDLHLNLGVLYELYRGEPSLALEQYRNYLELEGPASDRVRGWVEYLEGILENR